MATLDIDYVSLVYIIPNPLIISPISPDALQCVIPKIMLSTKASYLERHHSLTPYGGALLRIPGKKQATLNPRDMRDLHSMNVGPVPYVLP